jgi:hypothetical protein
MTFKKVVDDDQPSVGPVNIGLVFNPLIMIGIQNV